MISKKWPNFLFLSWVFLIFMYFDVPSKIEGSLWGVIKNFQINEIEKVRGGVEIAGNFFKQRNCAFVDLSAYISDETGFYAELETIQYDKGTIREYGKHNFGPWYIQVSPEDFAKVTLIFHHNCHPFWITETRINPS